VQITAASGVGADSDGDGYIDTSDNCVLRYNPDQLDADGDGYGNRCDADLNNNGIVDSGDYSIWSAAFGTDDPVADLNGDGSVDGADYTIWADTFGKAPGPSQSIVPTAGVQAIELSYSVE